MKQENRKFRHELRRKARREIKRLDDIPNKIQFKRDKKENYLAQKEIDRRKRERAKNPDQDRVKRNKSILDKLKK
jgi:hypothetical protein